MIEIEKRVLLNRKQFATLFQFLSKNAKGLGNFKRFSLINQERGDFIPDETALTDTRIRTTGDKGRLTLKYGSWHEASSREEYEVDFKSSQISELLNIFRILGNNYYVTTYIHRHEFE